MGKSASRVKHHYQPNDITCGPATLKMIGDALGLTTTISIEEIADRCGTNEDVGTTDVMMATGMRAIGIPFRIGTSRGPEDLAAFLHGGGYVILRTLTRDIKHWIALYAFEDGKFKAADPWLGDIEYTPEEIVSIWKPRDYFYFEVPGQRSVAERVVERLLR